MASSLKGPFWDTKRKPRSILSVASSLIRMLGMDAMMRLRVARVTCDGRKATLAPEGPQSKRLVQGITTHQLEIRNPQVSIEGLSSFLNSSWPPIPRTMDCAKLGCCTEMRTPQIRSLDLFPSVSRSRATIERSASKPSEQYKKTKP